MAIVRTAAVAAAVACLTLLGTPAHACDSNYPWLCKPVPSIDPPEAATEPSKAAAKPLPITARRAAAARATTAAKAAKTGKAAEKAERSAQTSRRHLARKSTARRWALRARHAKIVAAREKTEESEAPAPTRQAKLPRPRPADAEQSTPPSSESVADRSSEPGARSGQPNSGFAAIWDERSTGAAEAAEPAAPERAVSEPVPPSQAPAGEAKEAAPVPVSPIPVQVASQSEVNELDLAAAEPAAAGKGSWLRGVFLAFGGILALGSALRLFL